MSAHKHKWVWLPQIDFTLSRYHYGFNGFNVVCSVCGKRNWKGIIPNWKHGKGPTR